MYGPFRLEIELADGLSEGWYDHDWEELPEFRLMSQHHPIGWGGRIFDLGAHQGVVAILLARYVGSKGEVIAVEASPHNAAAAQRNVELNDARNCTILNAAVAAQSGRVIFNEGLNGNVDDGEGEWGRIEVDAFSIDDLTIKFGQPDLLFIDIEGYECHALRGASCTLTNAPDVFVEVHLGEGLEEFGGSVEQILTFFPLSDYTVYFNHEDGSEFRQFESIHELPRHRFFLFAVAKR
jgi:FkbM family methyltransferase